MVIAIIWWQEYPCVRYCKSSICVHFNCLSLLIYSAAWRLHYCLLGLYLLEVFSRQELCSGHLAANRDLVGGPILGPFTRANPMKQLSLNSMFGHAALTLREQTDLMKTALFKQLLLRSAFGHTALAMREQAALVKAALWNPEAIGAISNDRLASLLIAKLCLPGKVFIDIGAHIGSVFSEVHRNDASIKIIAFEAIPQKVSDLRKIFPYAEVHQFAIGESTGEVPFYINVSRSGYSSLSQFVRSRNRYDQKNHSSPEEA